MKFIIIIYTTNKLTVVEMEDIRGVRLRKFNLRKIILGVRMHFHHKRSYLSSSLYLAFDISIKLLSILLDVLSQFLYYYT